MLDDRTAKIIGKTCLRHVDWTIVGVEGGMVEILTGAGRYRALYGSDGSDPVALNSSSRLPAYGLDCESDGTVSGDHPVICTISVHDGTAYWDVRRMPPMPDLFACMDIANLELDLRFIHDDTAGYWPYDAASVWKSFYEDIEAADGGRHPSVDAKAYSLQLVFMLSELQEKHHQGVRRLPVTVIPEDAVQVRFGKVPGEWWDIRARSWDERFIVCVRQKPFHRKGRLEHTIIDRELNIRGDCEYLGEDASKDGAYTVEECEKLIERLSDPLDAAHATLHNRKPLYVREYR